MAKPSRGGKVYARREQESKPTPGLGSGKRVGVRELESYIDSHKATPLAFYDETIKVGGVEFKFTTEGTSFNSKGQKEYWADYQSQERADNGEYPIIHLSIMEKRRRGAKYYSWNRSVVGGTGFL